MNRYFQIRRLRGPVLLLLLGVMALLKELHILGFSQSWPLLLILAGVFLLAERAALTSEEMYPPMPVQGAGAQQNSAQPTSAIVPAHEQEYGNGHEGDQS